MKSNAARRESQRATHTQVTEPATGAGNGLILGIDPGLSRCGWALLRGDSLVEGCGSWTSIGDCLEERVDDIGRRVSQVIAMYDPELVAVESFVYHGGPISWDGMRTLTVIEHIRMVCRDYDVPCTMITPAAPKKRLRIKGKPSQSQMDMAFIGMPRTNQHGRDAVLVAWAGWLKGVAQ